MNALHIEGETIDEWSEKYQISYASGKPSPMKTCRKKPLSYSLRSEKLKDEAKPNKRQPQQVFSDYD